LDYDVAVVCFNEKFTIRRCLESIREYCPEARLIVIDDESTDGTAEVARELADVFVSSGKHSIGVSRQIALDRCDKPYLLYVDADVVLCRDPFPMLDLFSDPKIGAVRGRVRQLWRNRFSRQHGTEERGFIGFGCTFIDTEIARKVGGFRPLDRGEDGDFCASLHEYGYTARQDERYVYGSHYESKYLYACRDLPEKKRKAILGILHRDPGELIAANVEVKTIAEVLPMVDAYKYYAEYLESLDREG